MRFSSRPFLRPTPLRFPLLLLQSPTAMAGRSGASISLPSITFWLLLLCLNSGGAQNMVEQQKTWCVAKPSTSDAALNANLNFACAHVDCLVLQKDCAFPESLISHASIAMNLYYQASGRNSWNCFFSDSALIVVTDPSFNSCPYPFD